MDTTIDDAQPDDQDGDESLSNAEFPVSLDTLSVDGTNPQVGDNVEVKVGGKVTRIVNEDAYVKPETINGQPITKPPISPDDDKDEQSRLSDLSQQAGDIGSGGSGGY